MSKDKDRSPPRENAVRAGYARAVDGRVYYQPPAPDCAWGQL